MSAGKANSGKDKMRITEDGKPEVHLGHSFAASAERDKKREEMEERIIEPLGAFAGILACAKSRTIGTEDESEEDKKVCEMINALGYLLGLIITGARKEINHMVYGLDKDKLMEFILEQAAEQGLFDKDTA